MILQNGKRLDGCSDTVPVGTLQPFAGLVPPKGYLICQGQLVSKTKYPQLYAICGSQFGEETTSDFYLPDLRGKTIAGYDSDNELVNTIGKLLGAESHVHTTGNHTLTESEMPYHTHSLPSSDQYGKNFTPSNEYIIDSRSIMRIGQANLVPMGVSLTESAGSSQPHHHGDTSETSNYQPTIILNWIIKAVMLIPEYFIVENTLESNSVTNALSANQGRLLNEKFADYITYSESLANTQALSDRITALEEDNSLSGGTMEGNLLVTGTLTSNGRLTAGEVHSQGNWIWDGNKNFMCTSGSNNMEWSFDLGCNTDGSTSSSTGTYAQFWSMKNQNTIISFHNDDDMVNIPNGKLHIDPQVSWHTSNNYNIRLGKDNAAHLDMGYDGMQAKNSSNGAATLYLQYNGGGLSVGRSDAACSSSIYGDIGLAGNISFSGARYIHFPASAGAVDTGMPTALTYGRLQAYGTFCINANTDNSGTEYVILTAGHGLSSSTADGLAIGTSTLTWRNSNVPTVYVQSGQPSAKQTGDIWFIP